MANFCIVFLLTILVCGVHSWDNEELEIFDLVEEINQNFYTVLGIQQTATLQEVKRAFRGLSTVVHPDKSDAEDADVQFRNLVSVYEVLKDSGKREKYDKVLKDGLPNWKSALYYYRHVRKMGLIEMSLILFVIISIGQYFVAWAAYVEKKYTAEQILGSKLKKLQRKNKTNIDIETILSEIPPPSIKNTLPFQIPRAIWNTPSTIRNGYNMYAEYKQEEKERIQRESDELEHQKMLEEEFVKEKEAKGARKRKPVFVAPEKTDAELAGYSKLVEKAETDATRTKAVNSKAPVSGGLWTDEDLVELVRLVKKYPGGTTDRWEIIAEAMNRHVSEITLMAAKLKDNGYRIPGHTESVAETIVLETKKVKTKKDNQIVLPETTWTQDQQQALENAIVKYPKSLSSDRWSKIATCVPDKTKEECLIRYKYLVELVKQQKQSQETKELNTEVPEETPQSLPTVDGKTTKKTEKVETISEANDGGEVKNKGKPKNKRKERKKQMNFSSDEDGENDSD